MADKLNTTGTVDANMETSAPVKAMGARAEADLIVRRLLGIDVSTVDLRNDARRVEFSKNVATHVFNEIRRTRVAITQDELENDLDKNLQQALKLYDVDNKRNLTENENAHIIATALYEAMPKDVSRELLNQRYAFTSEKNPIGSVEAVVGFGPAVAGSPLAGNMNVKIDMTNAFWSAQRFDDAAELANALDKKKIGDIGMAIPGVSRATELSAAQAKSIAESAVAGWQITNLRGRYAEGRDAVTLPTGERLSWFVDLNQMVTSGTYTPSPPAVGPTRRFADMNLNELATCLRDPVCWTAVVRAPTGVPNTWSVRPRDLYPSGGGDWAQYVAGTIFERLQRRGTEKLGIANLHQFQQYQHRQGQLHQVYSRAQQSENVLGAAATAAILSRTPALAEKFPTLDKGRTEKLKNDIEKIKYAQKMIDDLKSVQANLTSIGKSFAASIADLAGLNTTGPTSSTSQDRDRWKNQVDQLNKDIAEYNKVARALQNIFNALNAAGLDGTKMGTYMTTTVVGGASVTTVNPAAIDNAFNPGSVSGDIERNVDIVGELKKKEDELKKTEGGEFSADALQQKIFAEYLKAQNPGLNDGDPDIEKGAKYLFARTLADGVVQQDIQSIATDLFGEEKEEGWVEGESLRQKKHDIDVINGVAKGVGVLSYEPDSWYHNLGPTMRRYSANDRYNNVRSPEWSRASYKQLCTAYFALKQVYDDPSHRLHLGRWKFVKDQMQMITKLLSTRYIQALVDDFGGNIDEEDRKKLKQGKAVTTATIEGMLSGGPPDKYKGKIDKVLRDVEGKIYWKGNLLKNTWEKTGAKVPWVKTGKAITSPVWWPAGKAIGLGGKATGWIVNNPGKAALLGAGAVLAGPIAAAIAYGIANKFEGGSASTPH